MKRLLLSLITTLSVFQALPAQNKVTLGYCEDMLGGSVSAQAAEPHEYGAAIYLTSDILNKYAGSEINRIDFAIKEKACDVMTVFITHDLNSQPVCTSNIYDIKEGWNSVPLKKTYKIKENDSLYIGYRFFTTQETLQKEVMTFDYTPGTTQGINWFSEDNRWWEFDSRSINFDLAIRAFAEGPSLPRNDAGIKDIKTPGTIICGMPYDYHLKMRNYGTDEIKTVKLNILANGDIYDTKELTFSDFSNNKEQDITLKDISFHKEGNNNMLIEVTEVNGQTDSDKDDNDAKALIYCINDKSNAVPREVLFEEFTTESDAESIKSDSVYRLAVKNRHNIIWVKHHLESDNFFISQEKNYSMLFENGSPFHPAIMVDRNSFEGLKERGPAYFVGHEDILSNLFDISGSIVSYIKPTADNTFDRDTRELRIRVNIKPEVKEMPLQTDLRLTVYIVEDNILSETQKGSARFIQNGVIRKIISDVWGDPIDISQGGLTKEYTCTVPVEWNEKNIRTVVFINNYDSGNPLNNIIYNACEAPIDITSGIDETDTSENELHVWYEDGEIRVSNGFGITGIHDVTGRIVNNISKGIYIVTVKCANGEKTNRKIIID